jgi:hypothetical protein
VIPKPDARMCKHRLPGFKASCVTIAVLYVLLGGSIVLRGTRASMAAYGVPEATLASPHYDDAIFWVYTHMIVIGLLTGVVGVFGEGERLKKWAARLLFAAHVFYTYLDFRSSDSILGNGLYRGPASLVPPIICLVVTLVFAHLSFCSGARKTKW